MTAAVAGGGAVSEYPGSLASVGRALIGRYQLLELIGAGGAGEVYAGHDPQLDRPVAVKRLRADMASSADRVQLAHEARINARLEHPNIVRVYDFLTVGNDDYIVSEYIDGSSLDELLTPERRDIEGSLTTALAIIRGLAYAHAAGVVHLDLKTENVLIGRDGVPKIADFGIAQLIEAAKSQQEQPSAAVIRGTFRSMSPEQTLASPADTRSDLFSFGTLLYELFGGVSPFHVKGNAAETIRRIREHQPLPLRELRADVPAALSELVEQLHRKDPADRPRSAREVEAVLQELLERRARRVSPLGLAEPPVERRLLSVLTLELCSPASGGDMEQAERYLREAARFQKAVASMIERHEAHLPSSLGHRAVICLGYPRAHDNNCERAARVFQELRRQLLAGRPGGAAELRGGLDVGETLLFAELAAGPALSSSAALCDAAHPGEFLVSSHAQRILRRFFAFELRGKLGGAGGSSEAPLREHYALVEAALGSALPARAQGVKPPMVGRDAELGALFEAFRASQAGTPRATLVVGNAGVGKSRLLHSFSDRLAESSASVVCLRARSEDQYSPFAPFAEFLAFGGDSAPRSRVRASDAPRLSESQRPPEPARGEAASASSYRQRMIDTCIERLLMTGKGQGLVLIVEDVHWLDHSSFELLRTLQARGAPEPVLIVLSGRPEIAAYVTERLSVQTLPVSRLTSAQALEVVQSVGGRRLPHRLAMQIIETADGLPLLIEELTLATTDDIDPAPAAPGSALAQVPSSLTESLDRRLELLGVARDTAQLLAALGRETVFAILEKVSELPARELVAQLARLCEFGLVVEEGEGPSRSLRFRHGLLRDAIYERLPLERRQELHRRIAATAEASFGGWLAERPDLFALHFARAGQWREALELATLSGEQAARKSCHFEACVHLQHALELLDKHHPGGGDEHDRWELAIRRLLVPSLNASDGWAAETVQANNARLLALSQGRTTSKPLAESWALFAHACLRHDRHGVNEALVYLTEAPASAARDAVLAVARGNVAFYQGEFSRAERNLLEARRLLEDDETRRAVLECGQELLVEGPCYLAWIYAIQGRDAASLEQRREMESSPEPLLVARAFGMLFSTALGILRREHESERSAQRARAEVLVELADLLRHPVFRAVADVALGRLRLGRGELDEGLDTMRRGYDLYEQSGTQLCLAEYAGFVAEAHLSAGRVATARELVDRVREQAAHPYCGFYRAEFLRIETEILIAEGRLSEATQVIESARACAATMAIDHKPQLFSERIALAHLRLRQAPRAEVQRAEVQRAEVQRAPGADLAASAPVLQR